MFIICKSLIYMQKRAKKYLQNAKNGDKMFKLSYVLHARLLLGCGRIGKEV